MRIYWERFTDFLNRDPFGDALWPPKNRHLQGTVALRGRLFFPVYRSRQDFACGIRVRFRSISEEGRTIITNEVRHHCKLKEDGTDADAGISETFHRACRKLIFRSPDSWQIDIMWYVLIKLIKIETTTGRCLYWLRSKSRTWSPLLPRRQKSIWEICFTKLRSMGSDL